MNKNEKQKKENGWEERWHAKMDAIEALWQTRLKENRSDYKKRSETKPRL
jgi:hypothetical protein